MATQTQVQAFQVRGGLRALVLCRPVRVTFAACLVLVAAACSGGGSASDPGQGGTNTAPTIAAMQDQTVTAGDTVTLTATATDADGDAVTISWSQTSGTSVTLSTTQGATTSFTAPSVTGGAVLVFEVSVTDGTDTTTGQVSVTVRDPASAVTDMAWIINTDGELSKEIYENGAFTPVNIQAATDLGDTVMVETNGVPGYEVTINQTLLDWYDGYQSAAYLRFDELSLGDIVHWGQDIGFSSTSCTNGDNGWRPAGAAACSGSHNLGSIEFPKTPSVATQSCKTGLGPIGMWVNGVFIYNWSDGFSYNDEGVWQVFVAAFRTRSMDICLGHGGGDGRSQYHHHTYSDCLRQQVGDAGTAHSPIYGYGGDGYPIHGPYHDAGVLAKSCWIARDYSATSSTGCGVDGERSCQFVDQLDPSQGVVSVANGPRTDDYVPTDGDDIMAVSGVYMEDYYYDASCTAAGVEYLDQYSGHDHDGLGYHYHVTVDDNMETTFPMAPAVEFRGQAGGSFSCSTR